MENAVHEAESDVQETKERLKEAREEAQEAAEEGMEGLREASKKVRAFVRDRPLEALGIAAAAGALTAALFSLAFDRQSRAERSAARVVRAGEEAWGQLRESLMEAATVFKGAVNALRK